MFQSTRFLPRVVLLAAVFQLGVAGIASAHHVLVSASAVCNATGGGATINFTATSWLASDPSGSNPQVDILFNGVKVASGAFGPSVFSFSGSAPAPAGVPAGGTVSVTAVAVAVWADGFPGGQSISTTVTIPDTCVQPGLGRFTGGGNQVRVGDTRVERGLTIHCDLLLSNNLEVNWGANHFHMLEHLTTIACTDDPNIIQKPPKAPLDTLVGIGTGRYNNVDGFTIRFTLVDAGEPGENDKMAILIYETANPGNIVLNVPLSFLTGGNLQAHYDQPHK